MKTPHRILAFLWLLVTPMAMVQAEEHNHAGDIRVDNPWSRPTPPGTPVGVGYLTLHNTGDQTVTLTGADSPRAGHVSIHQTVMQNGVMRMQPLAEGLALASGATQVFKPHGHHLMLEQLNKPLLEGEQVPVTLQFGDGSTRVLQLQVRSLDAPEPMDHSGTEH
ncbi:copper chaperone PCu(A)C [Marinobacter sp.]|uniref:copper chaperone PCu(A)C n=1 Tax=Marinobacter sp. TaxID=50741 RepID=UPI0019BA1840|nr:copper chaperone PCu(A)C [Marinobacter sp.]MBC7191060.1 copper chaperone PCu(A)C [Marinobacter sp.]